MSDDKSNKGNPDRDRINLNEDYEVQYWSEKFGVSKEQLKNAVKKVGPMVKDVEKTLKAKWRSASSPHNSAKYLSIGR